MPGFDGSGPVRNVARTGRGFRFWRSGVFSALNTGENEAEVSSRQYSGYGVGRGGFPRGGGLGRCLGGSRGKGGHRSGSWR